MKKLGTGKRIPPGFFFSIGFRFFFLYLIVRDRPFIFFFLQKLIFLMKSVASTMSNASVHDENAISLHNEKEEPYTIFSMTRLIQFLIITSLTGMLSPLTGAIYFPATNQIEAVNTQ